jgi:hypothetical protein
VQLLPPAESAHGQVGCPVKYFGKPRMQDRHCTPGQKGEHDEDEVGKEYERGT